MTFIDYIHDRLTVGAELYPSGSVTGYKAPESSRKPGKIIPPCLDIIFRIKRKVLRTIGECLKFIFCSSKRNFAALAGHFCEIIRFSQSSAYRAGLIEKRQVVIGFYHDSGLCPLGFGNVKHTERNVLVGTVRKL